MKFTHIMAVIGATSAMSLNNRSALLDKKETILYQLSDVNEKLFATKPANTTAPAASTPSNSTAPANSTTPTNSTKPTNSTTTPKLSSDEKFDIKQATQFNDHMKALDDTVEAKAATEKKLKVDEKKKDKAAIAADKKLISQDDKNITK